MFFEKRLWTIAAGLFFASSVMACGGTTEGTGGSGGSGTGGSSTGGSSTGGTGTGGSSTGGSSTGGSGTGGSSQSLADQGTFEDDCAPNDGPAIGAYIGTASVCDDTPNDTAQARFYAYPAHVDSLEVGQTWASDGGATGSLSVTWYPNGTTGDSEAVPTSSLEILGFDATTVELGYTFETAAGVGYSGTATVTLCDSTPVCG